MKRTIFILFVAFMALTATATQQESVAGLYPLEGCGRIVYNFNEGWRFWLGDVKGAETTAFSDDKWEVVCAPHIDRVWNPRRPVVAEITKVFVGIANTSLYLRIWPANR